MVDLKRQNMCMVQQHTSHVGTSSRVEEVK